MNIKKLLLLTISLTALSTYGSSQNNDKEFLDGFKENAYDNFTEALDEKDYNRALKIVKNATEKGFLHDGRHYTITFDMQDENGNTALHHALFTAITETNQDNLQILCDIINILKTNTKTLYAENNQGITPYKLREDFIKTPQMQPINKSKSGTTNIYINDTIDQKTRDIQKREQYLNVYKKEMYENFTKALNSQDYDIALKIVRNATEKDFLHEGQHYTITFDMQDKYGNTALHHALVHAPGEIKPNKLIILLNIINLLKTEPKTLYVKNNKGVTPYELMGELSINNQIQPIDKSKYATENLYTVSNQKCCNEIYTKLNEKKYKEALTSLAIYNDMYKFDCKINRHEKLLHIAMKALETEGHKIRKLKYDLFDDIKSIHNRNKNQEEISKNIEITEENISILLKIINILATNAPTIIDEKLNKVSPREMAQHSDLIEMSTALAIFNTISKK